MKTAFKSLLLTSLLTLASGPLHAQSMVPASMNYQGMLTDANGDVVAPNGPINQNLEFRIYSHASGGTPLWGEAQTVTVFKGHFSVVLGNGTSVGTSSGPDSFAAVFANATTSDLYFGITQQNAQMNATEFAPRQKLLSSAYALRSRVAEQVKQTSGDSSFNLVYANNLTMRGHTKIDGGNVLEFGTNDATRPRDTIAGQIGYQTLSGGLDIVGAGQTTPNRRITLWAEGGTELKGSLFFGERHGQHLNLWGTTSGIGVASNTMYSRVPTNQTFRWYDGGSHNDDPNSSINGRTLATLNGNGFTLTTGKFTGDGSGLTNINPNSLPNNYNYLGMNANSVIEFGRGVAGKNADSGKIGYGTFSSGASLDIVGAGPDNNRRIKLFGETEMAGSLLINWNLLTNGYTEAFGPVYAKSNIVIEGSGKLKFDTPSRTGQHINLWAETSGIGVGNANFYMRAGSGDTFRWYIGGSHDDFGPGNGGSELANWNNDRLEFRRRVIMTSTLDVNGQENRNMNYTFYARGSNGGTNMGAGSGIWPVSIQAAHRVVGSEFNALSDARLKIVQGISDSAADLQTLKTIEVVNYTMKDKATSGDRVLKKVVAQQVEKVYPQAVQQSAGVVPDIYRMAKAAKGFVTLLDVADLGLTKGETVRLLQDEREIITEITAVTAEGFSVKEAVDGELFVYGRRVKDVRTVDYEGLAMLNVSATQELSKQVKAQAEDLEKTRQERDALAKEVAELRAAAAAQTKRLSVIEAKIDALSRPAALPAALKTAHNAK